MWIFQQWSDQIKPVSANTYTHSHTRISGVLWFKYVVPVRFLPGLIGASSHWGVLDIRLCPKSPKEAVDLTDCVCVSANCSNRCVVALLVDSAGTVIICGPGACVVRCYQLVSFFFLYCLQARYGFMRQQEHTHAPWHARTHFKVMRSKPLPNALNCW